MLSVKHMQTWSHGWGRRWVVITPVPLPPQSSPLLSLCSTAFFLSASGFHYKDIKLKSRRGDKAANWMAWVMTVYSTADASLHAGLFHKASCGQKEGPAMNTNPLINAPQTAIFCPSVCLSVCLSGSHFLYVVAADFTLLFILQISLSSDADFLRLLTVTSTVTDHVSRKKKTHFNSWHGAYKDSVCCDLTEISQQISDRLLNLEQTIMSPRWRRSLVDTASIQLSSETSLHHGSTPDFARTSC